MLLEPVVGPLLRRLRLDLHVVHAGGRRSAPRPGDEPIDFFLRALHQGLDRAIEPIAHPSRDAEPLRLPLHGIPIPHALHLSANAKPLANHAKKTFGRTRKPKN
jgi:hypothetical protein